MRARPAYARRRWCRSAARAETTQSGHATFCFNSPASPEFCSTDSEYFCSKAAAPIKPVESAAQRGYRLLTEKPFLPADFNQEIFDNTWKTWPEPLRSQASKSSLQQRRQLAFQRYGLTTRPNDDSGKPLQYVVDRDGKWALNCFGCHGGKLLGQVIPGLPNTHYAMQTFGEEIRATKLLLGKPIL